MSGTAKCLPLQLRTMAKYHDTTLYGRLCTMAKIFFQHTRLFSVVELYITFFIAKAILNKIHDKS